MARVHRQLVALLDDRLRLVEARQVELRVDALREQVQRNRYQVDVAGALAVAEQRSFDTVGARHQSELCSRDGGAAVVVRVNADQDALACGDVPLEPLDAIGVHVRRERLDGRREVDDHPRSGRRLPGLHHRLADLERKLELGAVKALRRVLEDDLRLALFRQLLAERGGAHCEIDDAGLVEPEDDTALGGRRRVVEMHDRPSRPFDRLVRARDQLRPRLRQHRDRRVLRDAVFLDQPAHEVEVRLRRRRKPDFDLLHAKLDEQVEHPLLARGVHRLDERLVPVPQVGRAPDRRMVDHAVRPGAVGQVDGRIGAVFPVGHRHGLAPRVDGLLPRCGKREDGYVACRLP